MAKDETPPLNSLPELICYFGGPVLITAPHSLTLPPVHRKTHLREYGTDQMALSLARELHRIGVGPSIMVWNCTADPDPWRLDPNYLPSDCFADAQWHCALHKWLLVAGVDKPRLHIDLHGKITDELFLDIGVGALEQMWPKSHQAFVTALKCHFDKVFDTALMRCRVHGPRGNAITTQTEPKMDGYRSDGFATMSMQTAMLGVPSVQLEFPWPLRNHLALHAESCCWLAEGIADVFYNTVVPWHLDPSKSDRARLQHRLFECDGQHLDESTRNSGQPGGYVSCTSQSETDDVFAMLSGMAVAEEESHGSNWQASNDQFDMNDAFVYPAFAPCEACAVRVKEIGPLMAQNFHDWISSLLSLVVLWEQTLGTSEPSL